MKIRPNLQAIQELLRDKDLDALVCLSPENFTYLSGAHITTVKTMRARQAFAIVRRSGTPILVVCAIEKSLAKAESWIEDVRTYIEFRDDPVAVLADTLDGQGLGEARIGLDLDYLPASSHDRLRARLPGLRLENTTEAVAQVRAIKSPDEVALLERTGKDTHRAVLEALAESTLGDTEGTIANRIVHKLIDDGANGLQHVHLASGKRSPDIHNHPGGEVPLEGEILRLDVGGIYGAYCSDLARTYSTGKPTPMQRETYRGLVEVQAATIAAMRPGVPAEDIFFLCKAEFEKRGLLCTLPHIGHSFGIEAHEAPMIRPGDKTLLAPGMVINIEPMTVDTDGSCYHTEDHVLITETGNRVLTHGLAPKEIPVLGVPLT